MRSKTSSRGDATIAFFGRDGMTLIELMISLVVMSIGILGVAMMFPYGNESSLSDRNLTHAVELAQEKMEQLRTKSYIDPDLETGWHPSGSWEQVGPNNNFDRRYAIGELGSPNVSAKYVRVEVTWTSARPDTVRLATYIKR
jgi:prepilin-type N-terminal cleavage/methylation domain-containing protein